MHATPGSNWDAVDFLTGFWLIFSFETLWVCAQEGNGCGHTLLSTKSGTLTSRNYPGTYPNHTQCEWSLRVPRGHTLLLAFGDFDLEKSQDCRVGSLTIADSSGTVILGPLCGQLDASGRNVSLSSAEVTVRFVSGTHLTGRGFLLSYTTNQHPDLISCLRKGTHFRSQQFSVFCPAGCKDVAGDIWGQYEQGYRDTSVLCKAAIHAGVLSDSQGGTITVSQERGITLYESSFANGILSKTGPLSDKRLVFRRDCDSELTVSGFNASSAWEGVDSLGQRVSWFPGNRDASGQVVQWAANSEDREPWLELELRDRSSVTGIITKGMPNFYIESFILLFSKDRKIWKVYKSALSKEKKVFEVHSDGHLSVLSSLFPPVVARYLLLRPQRWHLRPSAHVQVLGCTVLRPRSAGGSPSWKVVPTETLPQNPISTEGPVIVKSPSESSSQPVLVVVGVVLGLTLCVGCLLAGLWWRRRKRAMHMKKCSLDKGCQGFHGKKLPCTDSELISCPLARNVHDTLPSPPLNDYAEPDVLAGGQKLGSTFRAAVEEGYTVPFMLNHYDTPGKLPEYAEPLPPEPEYATPFGDQPPEPPASAPLEMLHNSMHFHLLPSAQGTTRTAAWRPAQYDCPAQRAAADEYRTPPAHGAGPRKACVIYAEPQAADPLLQHPYHEPL